MTEEVTKKTLENWLAEVDYAYLNDGGYIPSQFALIFANFIKLVNGKEGEENKTPPVHLKMLDKLTSKKKYIANLCFRGSGKTTVFFEYLVLFIAVFQSLPGMKNISGMIYVSDSMDNGVKSARKNIEYRYNNSEFLQEWIPHVSFTDPYIEFQNKDGHRLGVKLFGAKTGIRGTKVFGKRPTLAVLDDLVSDDDAKSQASMQSIKDTVDKGIDYALHPTKRKVIFNGTPFNKTDILIEAVESGAWDVNVWPVCERFPCSKEEFQGAWEDRFSYEYVKDAYDRAKKAGKLHAFYQELMLQITSEEERLVQDGEIGWYSRQDLLNNRSNFNFYITTDFAVSAKQRADFSVISVWAYGSNGDWFWVDGQYERVTMDKTVENLFKFVSEYQPYETGIEINGQQAGFIPWIKSEMMKRNVWFSFAKNTKSGEPGIRSVNDKMAKFAAVLPLFKTGKIHFPVEMKESKIVSGIMNELRLATVDGFKGKDDGIDTISQLQYLKPIKPVAGTQSYIDESGVWGINTPASTSTIDSYVV